MSSLPICGRWGWSSEPRRVPGISQDGKARLQPVTQVSASRQGPPSPEWPKKLQEKGASETEARYAGYLDGMKHTGEVVAWAYEAVKLRLADKTFYTPDFVVIRADGGIELHEVKGHWEDDARVKIKVAAIQHPWFRFLAVKAGKTGWQYETFGGGA